MKQPSVVVQTKDCSIEVVHVALALQVKYVEELEEGKRKHCPGPFPCSRKPALAKDLRDEVVVGLMWWAAAICDPDLMYTVDVIHCEITSMRDRQSTHTSTVAELDDKSKIHERSGGKIPIPEDLNDMRIW
jgi:hypothetical protein